MKTKNLKQMPKQMLRQTEPEKRILALNGFFMLIPFCLTVLFLIYMGLSQLQNQSFFGFIFLIFTGIGCFWALAGFFILNPNEAIACTFFGSYSGSHKQEGFWYTNPFYQKRKISLKMLNYASERIKVNEATGSPIEVECVVSWCVENVHRALFAVQNYQEYLETQVEAALRQITAEHPYEPQPEQLSLRSDQDEISELIEQALQNQCNVAGLKVMDARISHLAYAPEVAQMMLKRQQAQAVVTARQTLVDGAIGMVKDTVVRMESDVNLSFTQEQKAQLVINMMTVLLSDAGAAPVLALSGSEKHH